MREMAGIGVKKAEKAAEDPALLCRTNSPASQTVFMTSFSDLP
jgi:hypothetical protein